MALTIYGGSRKIELKIELELAFEGLKMFLWILFAVNKWEMLSFGSLPFTLPDCDIVNMFWNTRPFVSAALIIWFITSTSPTVPFREAAMNDFHAHEMSIKLHNGWNSFVYLKWPEGSGAIADKVLIGRVSWMVLEEIAMNQIKSWLEVIKNDRNPMRF